MELEKQKLLLSYLISDQELFIKVSPILQTKYFDPRIKNAVDFVKNYFDQYKAAPTADQVRAETKDVIEVRPTMTRSEIQYAENQLETFCREKAIEHAILQSAPLANEGKYGEIEKIIREAISVGVTRNIGLDYFQDPEARLKLLSLNNKPISTGFIDLDEHLGGGLNRKEMVIFAAPPGVGKSLTLSNLAKNLMKQGLNGCYITLELSEEVVAKRFDSMFSGVAQIDILKNITKTSIEIKKQSGEYGSLMIKRMPESTTNASHIRAYVKEYEIIKGHGPDFIIVDYLDLMASNMQVSADNIFMRDKYISEELRALANEWNCIMATAAQLGRASLQIDTTDDLSQAHIAGGISKVNTADNLIYIYQTLQMKARGEMLFKLMKTRSSGGVGNSVMMTFNSNTLVMACFAREDAAGDRSKSLASYVARGKVAAQPGEEKPATQTKMTMSNIPFQV